MIGELTYRAEVGVLAAVSEVGELEVLTTSVGTGTDSCQGTGGVSIALGLVCVRGRAFHCGEAAPGFRKVRYRGRAKNTALWLLPPNDQISLVWRFEPIKNSARDEARRINREALDAVLVSRGGRPFQYDVALSFAGEDRAYVEQVAQLLREGGIRVFYDRFEEANLWGRDLYEYLSDVYNNQARYTVLFISEHYANKMWTTHERKNAQARALRENAEYILPARFDDSEVPGLPSTIGYLPLHNQEPSGSCRSFAAKT